jgi:hypothetical protein
MNDDPVMLLLHVDDVFLTDEEKIITDYKKKLATKFEMKDLMHYLLGLEVWQSPEKIFLNQGKYAVEILKRFDMLECKSMNTPMETKLKVDTSSKLVDATLYRQIIGSLMYDQARYMFCYKHLESVSGRAHTCSPCCYKTCDEIP